MIREVLRGVSDDKALGEYETIPKPLLTLVQAYNEFLLTDKELPIIDKETTGEMIKNYIENLDSTKIIELLHLYIQMAKGDADTEREEERIAVEERNFLSRMAIQLIVGVTLITFVGYVSYVCKTQDITKIKNSMFDIINVIFTQKDKNG